MAGAADRRRRRAGVRVCSAPTPRRVAGTPDTVVPIPALAAAAFFGAADADAIARASAGVILHRRGAAEIVLGPSARRVVGESLVYLEPRPAAYVEAYDEHGAHLTITQPTNASFLSPVLLFRQRQRIGALDVPFDTFATPGRHRVVRALYFTPRDLAQFNPANAGTTRPALVVSVADDAGKPLGITLAADGHDVTVARHPRARDGRRVSRARRRVRAADVGAGRRRGAVRARSGVERAASGQLRAGARHRRRAVVDDERAGGGDRRVRERADGVDVAQRDRRRERCN